MPRILREPLLHFLFLGALLFACYGWLNRGASSAPEEIVLTSSQMENLQNQFVRTWQRPPTSDEMQGVVNAWVREEVLYREGLAMGLDRDDPVVRRRIAQKINSLADGLVTVDPTDAELQGWLDAHPDNYRVESTFTFRQIYFDAQRRGDRIETDIAAARAALSRGQAVSGDATMLPAALESAPSFEIGRIFGTEFAARVASLPLGSWQGPVESGYGLHLIEVQARQEGRVPNLAEVRAAVERDLLSARTSEASEAFYGKLRARYRVRVDAAIAPTGSASPAAFTQ